jgi:nitrite reductase (NADH) large subunit
MCRVRGPVKLSFELDQARARSALAAAPADPSIRSVIIIGNGIAGVTAADYVRRRHGDCEIHLVSQERHQLYNSRLAEGGEV